MRLQGRSGVAEGANDPGGPLQHILVFDIETVPDRDSHEGTKFTKPPFQKIVAIGFRYAEIERRRARGRSPQGDAKRRR